MNQKDLAQRRLMRIAGIITGICAVLVNGCGTAPSVPTSKATNVIEATPLILENDEGERRVWLGLPGHSEPGSTFILKVDPKNGGSSHLVFGTEDLEPGGRIDTHVHPGADEILFLQSGTARVHLGDSEREVHGGATVFIPVNTRISVSNVGSEVIHLAFVFSAPGFEEFMRAESVREGEKNVPLSKAEDEEIQRKHSHVIYQ
jgi:quercetin dioxygenase-like cupin family protein